VINTKAARETAIQALLAEKNFIETTIKEHEKYIDDYLSGSSVKEPEVKIPLVKLLATPEPLFSKIVTPLIALYSKGGWRVRILKDGGPYTYLCFSGHLDPQPAENSSSPDKSDDGSGPKMYH
jgi:hypothetical protein